MRDLRILPHIKNYQQTISNEVEKLYKAVSSLKQEKYDPLDRIHTHISNNLIERVSFLIQHDEIRQKLQSFEFQCNTTVELVITLIKDLLIQHPEFTSENDLLEFLVRLSFIIASEGHITASEGITKVERSPEGYLHIHFRNHIGRINPEIIIITLISAEYIRQQLHIRKYYPKTEEEKQRIFTEVELFDVKYRTPYRRNLIDCILNNLKIRITSEPTPKKIGSASYLRPGMCFVLTRCFINQLPKFQKLVELLSIPGWRWLSELQTRYEEQQSHESYFYKSINGGKPVFSYPIKGGFTVKLGRARNTGFGVVGIHPCSAKLLRYLVPGTKVLLSDPLAKFTIVPVDSIEGPIVELNNQSCLTLETLSQYYSHKKEIKKVIELGEILVDPVDFLQIHSTLTFDHQESNSFTKAALGELKCGMQFISPPKVYFRHMNPLAHVLFPIGSTNLKKLNILKFLSTKSTNNVELDIPVRSCSTCRIESYLLRCEECGGLTVPMCQCGGRIVENECEICQKEGQFKKWTQNVVKLLKTLEKYKREKINEIIGIRSFEGKNIIPEHLLKGIFRAYHKLQVYRDGTTRIAITNGVLTHFYPAEIETPVERLRTLGYLWDINGKPLQNTKQLVELFPQDIIVNYNAASKLQQIANFIDDILMEIYQTEPFFRSKDYKDLIGQFVLSMNKNSSTGSIGRIVGFTKHELLLGTPEFHGSKGSHCRGEQDNLMLLIDIFINFSPDYLPLRRSHLDLPLFIIAKIPLKKGSANFSTGRKIIHRLPEFEGVKINDSPLLLRSLETDLRHKIWKREVTHHNYLTLNHKWRKRIGRFETLMDRVEGSLALAEIIQGIDIKNLVYQILTNYFFQDLFKDLRDYIGQKFRCKECSWRGERPTLSGRCPKCLNEVDQTIFPKSALKYFEWVENISERYEIPKEYLTTLEYLKIQKLALFEGKVKLKPSSLKKTLESGLAQE